MLSLRIFVIVMTALSAMAQYSAPDVFQLYHEPTISTDDDNTCQQDTNTCSSEDIIQKAESNEFFGVFRKLGISWSYILSSYRRVIRLAGGVEERDDVHVETEEDALLMLQEWAVGYEFQELLLKRFNKTRKDLLLAFVRWSAANGAHDLTSCPGGSNGRHEKINVSKAWRRLKAYQAWMNQHEDWIDTRDDLQKALSAFAVHVTQDACERVVWWLDLGQTNQTAIQALSSREIWNFFVHLSHVMVLNPNAQTNGIVFVNHLGRVNFLTFMTMLPLHLGIQTDEFMICVIPLNTKAVLFLGRPAWVKFAYGLLQVFLTREMKSRVYMLNDNDEQASAILGKDKIVQGFSGLQEGKPNLNLLDEWFVTQK
jgi:hypothetical protein